MKRKRRESASMPGANALVVVTNPFETFCSASRTPSIARTSSAFTKCPGRYTLIWSRIRIDPNPGLLAMMSRPSIPASRRQDHLGPTFAYICAGDDFFELPPVNLVKEIWIFLQVSYDLEPRHGDSSNQASFRALLTDVNHGGLNEDFRQNL